LRWDGGKVNLQIYAIKRGNQKLDSCIQLIVVDLDKSKRYPLNFVCVLPRYLRVLEKRSSNFAKIFGEKSLCIAKKLLVEARHREEDPQIQKVITKRIREISVK
jgi:hypothetical protein